MRNRECALSTELNRKQNRRANGEKTGSRRRCTSHRKIRNDYLGNRSSLTGNHGWRIGNAVAAEDAYDDPQRVRGAKLTLELSTAAILHSLSTSSL